MDEAKIVKVDPPLPCGTLTEWGVGENEDIHCDRPASVAIATPSPRQNGRWLLLPRCAQCTQDVLDVCEDN